MAIISGGKVIEGAQYRAATPAAATGATIAPVQLFSGEGAGGTTYDGVAAIGALYVDVTAKKLYINTGTLASNTWTLVGSQT